jgi:hypothetical protein
MAGGGLHSVIDVPPASKWESETGAPLALRDEIIVFVASETQRQQAPSWRYRITDRSIDFF